MVLNFLKYFFSSFSACKKLQRQLFLNHGPVHIAWINIYDNGVYVRTIRQPGRFHISGKGECLYASMCHDMLDKIGDALESGYTPCQRCIFPRFDYWPIWASYVINYKNNRGHRTGEL
jgi:hypothetical protein